MIWLDAHPSSQLADQLHKALRRIRLLQDVPSFALEETGVEDVTAVTADEEDIQQRLLKPQFVPQFPAGFDLLTSNGRPLISDPWLRT